VAYRDIIEVWPRWSGGGIFRRDFRAEGLRGLGNTNDGLRAPGAFVIFVPRGLSHFARVQARVIVRSVAKFCRPVIMERDC
jgi:hypothetical protein